MSEIARVELPTPFGVGPVNAYLVPGRRPLVVDCGMDFRDSKERLAAAIADVLGGAVYGVVLTHSHIDHCGLAGWVQETYDARLALHPRARATVEAYPKVQHAIAERYREPFVAAGLPIERYDEAAARMIDTAHWWTKPRVDYELTDGERILADHRSWRIRHLPGHAPGHVGLFAEDGTALTGDTVIPQLSVNAFFDGGQPETGLGLSNHLATLRRLLVAAPRRIGPGHRGWVDDPAGAIDEALALLEDRLAFVLDLMPAGEPVRPWDLVPAIYGDVTEDVDQAWLAVADLLGTFELLRRRGRVQLIEGDGFIEATRLEGPEAGEVETEPAPTTA